MKKIKGYKVFNPDMTCIGLQYEVGKEYVHKEKVVPCRSGFHFCKKAVDCFNYYAFDSCNKVCEVEGYGETLEHEDKIVCSKIKIIKELSWIEVLEIVNIGKNNTGHRNSGDWNSGHMNSGDRNSGDRNSGNRNSGDWNSGDWNSGNWNSGHRNSGDRNSGHRNSGDWNSGDWNSGDCNSGHRNSGDCNSGHRNSGDWNSGDCNSGNWNSGDWNRCNNETGYFNSISSEKIRVFNKECDIELWKNAKKPNFIYDLYLTKYEDKKLITFSYKEAWLNAWNEAKSKGDWRKEYIKLINLPNFDKEVFKEITGLDVDLQK